MDRVGFSLTVGRVEPTEIGVARMAEKKVAAERC